MRIAARRPALRKNRRLPRAQERFALTTHEPEEILRRAKAALRLQSCDCLRCGCVAAHADCESDFSILRNSELGRASRCAAARYRISRGDDSCLGVRANA